MLFNTNKMMIGMLHLPPLIGYPTFPGMDEVIVKSLKDLETLEKAGFDGILVENDNDTPHQVTASPEIIAALTVVTMEVIKHAKNIIVGVEFLLNDPMASIAIAKATDAKFVRSDYFVDRMARDEYGGEMVINPKQTMDYKKKIQADNILFFADIQVKYARMLETKTIDVSARQAKEAGADAAIISGTKTGEPPTIQDVMDAKKGTNNFPILIGSGLTSENAKEIMSVADGAIVGTSIKTGDYIDERKASELMEIVNKLRK